MKQKKKKVQKKINKFVEKKFGVSTAEAFALLEMETEDLNCKQNLLCKLKDGDEK